MSPKEHQELKSYIHHLYIIDSQQALFELSHRIEPRVWAPPPPPHVPCNCRTLSYGNVNAKRVTFLWEKKLLSFISKSQDIHRKANQSVLRKWREPPETGRGLSSLLAEAGGRRVRRLLEMERSGFLCWHCWSHPVFNLSCAGVKTREHVLLYSDQIRQEECAWNRDSYSAWVDDCW